MRINVSCSRADFDAFPVSSSSRSAVHRPNFGRGWTSRSYSKDVSPDRRTLRTVLRDTLRSRAISLIVLPLIKCSRRIRAIVSTTSIPHHLLRSKAGSATGQPIGGQFWKPIPQLRGSKLHAETQQGEIGPDLFRAACNMGLEGLVSKRRDRPYRGGRSPDWVKVKNRTHPAMERVKEAFA